MLGRRPNAALATIFSIKSHVDDVRARLAARLVQTRSQIVKVA